MQVKKQQLEPDTKQRTGLKLGKEYVKASYCHPAYLTYMQWRTSWNQDCWESIWFSSEMPSRGEWPEDRIGLVPAESSTLHKEELNKD